MIGVQGQKPRKSSPQVLNKTFAMKFHIVVEGGAEAFDSCSSKGSKASAALPFMKRARKGDVRK